VQENDDRRLAWEIAVALRASECTSIDLAGGAAGLAIAFDRFDTEWPGEGFGAIADALLDAVVRGLVAVPLDAGLYRGLSGAAWALAALPARAGPERMSFLAEDLDARLLAHLQKTPWRGHFDLVGGLAGVGLYGLARADRRIVDAVVERLAELAVAADPGLAWFTPPEMLSDWKRARCPDGHCDLGLAHGAPGPVAFLGAAGVAGTGTLLEGAVEWLLAQDQPGGFRHWVGGSPHPNPSVPHAWCYGDPGVAVALLAAARGAGRDDWEARGLAIAHRAAAREPRTTRVRDAPICHGAAGLGHLFGRLHAATGDGALAAAARMWLDRVHELRTPGVGIAGFPFLRPEPVSQPGLLEGAAGVALALLSAPAPGAARWDGFLGTRTG
jgi:lantibiotic modifying enzyme